MTCKEPAGRWKEKKGEYGAMRKMACVLAVLCCLALGAAAQEKSVPRAVSSAIRDHHPNPFTHVRETDFEKAVQALEGAWEELCADGEAGFALRELVASLGDEHTTVLCPREQERILPFFVLKFEDEYILVQAQQEEAAWTGMALEAIGGVPAEEIARRMDPYISPETEGWRDTLTAEEMTSVSMLMHVGAMQEPEQATVTVRDPRTGQTQTADVKTLDGGYDFSTSVIMPMAQTLMQSGFYYATLLEGGELFIQYNLCQDNPQMPMADFAKALREQLAGMQRPEKILVDLRNNGGGNSEVIRPLLDLLSELRDQGSRIYALIGDRTFSSGVLNAQDLRDMGATLVGEPTGGVRGFGELTTVELGEGYVLSCSTKDFSGGKEHRPVEPDRRVEQTVEDLLAGVDSAVSYVQGL